MTAAPTPTLRLDDLISKPEAETGPPKPSILVLGEEKSGKSSFLFTMPEPILCIQTDPNEGALNSAVAAGRDVRVIRLDPDDPAKSWATYATTILPAVANREVDVASVVIDSYAYLFQMMQAAIPLPTSSTGKQDTFKYWAQVKETADKTMRRLARCTNPFPADPSRRTYHIGVACHLTEVTTDTGGVIGYRPAVQGGFKNEVGRIFTTVLYMEGKEKVEAIPNQQGLARTKEFLVHTVSPNDYVKCGDSIGGVGGKWQALPAALPNTGYPGLATAWGFPT